MDVCVEKREVKIVKSNQVCRIRKCFMTILSDSDNKIWSREEHGDEQCGLWNWNSDSFVCIFVVLRVSKRNVIKWVWRWQRKQRAFYKSDETSFSDGANVLLFVWRVKFAVNRNINKCLCGQWGRLIFFSKVLCFIASWVRSTANFSLLFLLAYTQLSYRIRIGTYILRTFLILLLA